MSWTLFSSDKKLSLDGCSKRCGKCGSVRPASDFDTVRTTYGAHARLVSLGERCESCRNPAENDKQGELGL